MRRALAKAKQVRGVNLRGKGAYYRKGVGRRIGGRLRGRGDYFTDAISGIGKSLGTIGDAALGGIPRSVVNRVGRFLSGKGDYSVSNLGAGKIDMGHEVPRFGNISKQHSSVICHTEYIQDISSATSFTNTSFPVNPGMQATFPWLSTVASNYEEYKFKSLVFFFRSTSAVALNSTNTALGVVIGATNYNATQAAFLNKQAMENYQFAKSAPPSVDQIFPVECDRKMDVLDHLYIRSGSLPANADIRMSDLGTFQLAVTGSQAAAVVGELWVAYEVELFKPSLNTVGSSDIAMSHYGSTAFTSTIMATVTATNPFGTPTVPTPTSFEVGSNIALTFGATGAITFPASIGSGSYMVLYTVKGSSTALTNATTWAATTNCSVLQLFDRQSAAAAAMGISAAATSVHQISMFMVSVTGPAPVVTMTSGTLPTSISAMDVFVFPINPSILTKKQMAERNSVVRYAADPHYDPFTGKYDTEELEEDAQAADAKIHHQELADDRYALLDVLAELLAKRKDKSDSKRELEYVEVEEPRSAPVSARAPLRIAPKK